MDRIYESFAKQTMMQTLGAELTRVASGQVDITAPILEGSKQQHGAGHAALAFAIGDSAAGYAALTMMEEGAEVMTAEIKINLLAPSINGPLLAKGRVVKAGRRLIVVQSDIFDAKGKQIAILQGTMVPV